MDIKKEYERWLENATADANVAAELKTLDNAKIEDAFYRDLAFGTGGLRGVIGAGTNRMNIGNNVYFTFMYKGYRRVIFGKKVQRRCICISFSCIYANYVYSIGINRNGN